VVSADADDTTHPAERRMVLRLLRHWRDISNGREMPAVGALKGDAIPDMWPCCYVLDLGGGKAPCLENVGTSFAEEQTTALNGHPVSEIPADTLLAHATHYWRKVVEKRVPISIGGEFHHRDGRVILYRSIILPLSTDERQIDHLLGAANYRLVVTG